MPECSVVIVNYNAGHLLTDSVNSALTEGAQKIIVVDNNSHDDSITHLRTNIQDNLVIVINNEKNVGFATACNQGIKITKADALLFLNPDCILKSDALSRMLEVLNSAPNIGMVGGLLSNPDGSEQPGGRRVFPTPRRAFMRAFGMSRFGKRFSIFSDFLLHLEPLPSEPVTVEAISGACMLVKREAIEDVGLLDEGYFLHCEDLDLCMRFRQKGWKILFVPDAKIIHIAGSCSKSRPIFVEWHKHKGMLRFYRKFFRHQYPGVLMWLVTLGVWFRFILVAGYYVSTRIFNTSKSSHV